MSRESFKDFIHSIDHNQSLRRKVADCENDEDLITVARSHHFNITKEDISADKKNSEAAKWFETSKIKKSFQPSDNKQ